MFKNKKKYYLAFATNFKNENAYLCEWLEYHMLVGVDHFYLYDQDDNETAKKILRPYENSGLVTRHPWTHYDGTKFDGPTRFYQKNKNHMAFTHCVQHYKKQFCWIMKIDIDEFLYPLNGEDNLTPYLKSFDLEKTKGIRIPRFNYGNNGHLILPKNLVIESYTRREATASDHKDLANSLFLSNNKYCYSAHNWHYKFFKRGIIINENNVTGLRINHYYTKSLEEYQMRQNVSGGRGQTESHFIERNKNCNAVKDTGMLRFAKKLNNLNKAKSKDG